MPEARELGLLVHRRWQGAAAASRRTLSLPVRWAVRHVPLKDRSGETWRGPSWAWQPTLGPRWHDAQYAEREDPYDFASDPYEQQKYADTLNALGGRRFRRALEMGCAEGVFTEMLAEHCDELIAVDISDIAVERCRARVAGQSAVSVERRALPVDLPPGTFDLVVASDVMYYWPPDVIRDTAAKIFEVLREDGLLVAVHYLGHIGAHVTGGVVHDLLTRQPGFVHEAGLTRPGRGQKPAGYRLDVFRRPASEAPLP